MSTIQRQRVLWTGFPGSPGISTFYFTDAALSQAALGAFLAGVSAYLPPDVNLAVEATGDVLVAETGVLSGGWIGTNPSSNTGTGPVSHAAAAGFYVKWDTGTVLFGHHLRGKTYFVPCSDVNFSSQGNFDGTAASAISALAATFIAAHPGNLLVWSRPRAAVGAWTGPNGKLHKAVTARDGGTAPVENGTCMLLNAILTSRRD